MKRKRVYRKRESANLSVRSTDKTLTKSTSPDVEDNSNMLDSSRSNAEHGIAKQNLLGDRNPDKGASMYLERSIQGPPSNILGPRTRSCDAPKQIQTHLKSHLVGTDKQRTTKDKMEVSGNSLPRVDRDDIESSSSRDASMKVMALKGSRSSSTNQNMIICALPAKGPRFRESKPPQQDFRYAKQELESALEVINKIMKMDVAEPFNAPVNPIELGIPDYLDVIETPMDFGTIRQNLESGRKYKNSVDVYKDVQYIWENCCKYNSKGTYIMGLMERVKQNFTKYWFAAGLHCDQPKIDCSENIVGEPTTHEKKHEKGKRGFKTHKYGCPCPICTRNRRRQEREVREAQEACKDDDEETESDDAMEVEEMHASLAQESSRQKARKNVYDKDDGNASTSENLELITENRTPNECSEQLKADAQELVEAAKRWHRALASESFQLLETPTPVERCSSPFSNNFVGSDGHSELGSGNDREIHAGLSMAMAMDPKYDDVDKGTQNEQHLEEGGKQRKKKTRGPSRGIKAKKNKTKDLHWTPLLQPYGASMMEFKSYLGVLVKSNCDINLRWKQVDKAKKDMLWADAQKTYNIPDGCKKRVLGYMSTLFRGHKHNLVSGFITCTKPRKDSKQPWEVYEGMITEEQWKRFYAARTTPEFRAIQEKNKRNQEFNIHKHYMGAKGYIGKISEWKAAGLIPTSTNDSPSFTGAELVDRTVNWKLARLKKNEHGTYYFPNEKTKEVVDKIDEMREQVAQGVWTPHRQDDVLARALEKQQHSGRVVGHGGGVRIRDVFGNPGPRSGGPKGGICMEEFTKLTARLMEKVKEETRDEMNHLVDIRVQNYLQQHHMENYVLQPHVENYVQHPPSGQGTSQENQVEVPSEPINSTSSVASADASADPYPFAYIQGMVKCRLALKLSNFEETIVAEGMLLTSNSTTMVHHEALHPYHAKVSVDHIMDGYRETPLPVTSGEIATLEQAHLTFVQWPVGLVYVDGQMPTSNREKCTEGKGGGPPLSVVSPHKEKGMEDKGDEPQLIAVSPLKENGTDNKSPSRIIVSLHGDKGTEDEGNGPQLTITFASPHEGEGKEDKGYGPQLTIASLHKEVGIEDKDDEPQLMDASFMRPPIVNEQMVQLLGECVRQLHDYIMLLPYDIDSCRLSLDHETFHYESDAESIILIEDVAQLMRRRWLTVSIIQAYIPCLVEKMNDLSISSIGFVCPERVSSIKAKADPKGLQNYLKNAFLRMKEKKYILIPYRQNTHWILLIMCLADDKLLVLDPLGKGRSKIEILRQIELVFHVHRVTVQKKRTHMRVCHMDCPRQSSESECGYYVMRYMYDIVIRQSSSTDLEKVFDCSSFTEDLISEVLDDWAKYMYDTCSF